jgi:hypothetical protein
MAMVYMWYAEWGNGGRLWGTVQPLRVFNGLVDGLAVIPVLLRGAFAADVAAVFVVVRLGYAAAFQELFRPEFSAFPWPDGLRDGEHHVADAQVLFRAHGDST